MNKLSKVLSIIVIILLIIIVYFFTKTLQTNNSDLENNYTHIIISGKSYGNIDENDTVSTIYTFDNNDIVINARVKLVFENEESTKKSYELAIESEHHTGVKITDNILCYNENNDLGHTKQELLEAFSNSEYDIVEY